MVDGGEEATATPKEDDDFFSSWDKPAIKRPTPPPSRTATPPVVGRSSSPLNPASNGNGIARSKSPLNPGSGASTPAEEKPAAPRTTTSSALRNKTGSATSARKGVLGAKKTQKLGAKKVGAAEVIDFDAAEKKAKEEAERIAKLGYDPDAEEEKPKATEIGKGKAAVQTPSSPQHSRKSSDAERLGLQMNRLGFGMTAGTAPKAAPKKMGGFGSVGPIKNDGGRLTFGDWRCVVG